MQRREFIALVSGTAVAWPFTARAQKSGKMQRVAILSTANPRSASFYQAFEQRLRDLGYIEARTSRSSIGTPVVRLTGCLVLPLNWFVSTSMSS